MYTTKNGISKVILKQTFPITGINFYLDKSTGDQTPNWVEIFTIGLPPKTPWSLVPDPIFWTLPKVSIIFSYVVLTAKSKAINVICIKMND